MFLSKRSNGIYYLWYEDELERRCKISTRTALKSEAVKYLRDFNSADRQRQEKAKRLSLSQFASDFLEYSKSVHAPNTCQLFKVVLEQLQKAVGDIPLHCIGVREIEQFLSAKKSSTSAVTAKKYYLMLASAFETAKRWNCLGANPFRQVEKPKTPEVQPAYFSRSDFRTLMKVIDDEDFRDLCLFAVLTGMRLSEILALQWTNIDFVRKAVLVQNSEMFTTKSRKNRTIPMNEQLWKAVAIRKENAKSEFVFHRDGQRLRREEVSKRFKAYVIAAGLRQELHFHSLRHTFATWLVQDGVNIYEVQKLLGHSTITVTQMYSHLAASELHGAVSKITVSLN